MKKSIFYLLFLIMLTALSCNRQNKSSVSGQETTLDTLALKVAKLHISGMTCGNCENKVTQTLTDIPGVIVSKVSHLDSLAVLEFDTTQVEIANIIENIETLHYTVDDYKVISGL